ncbi:MAG: hypothetical protein P1U89_10855 [Verrucomicrobiales bacterium]|nr:hypothetical protein [Verrucomicrobiales bacterium]
MELSVEPLTVPDITDQSVASEHSLNDWNEAYTRVEAYLSSLGVTNKLLLSSLVLKVLGIANDRLENEPDRPAVELAAEEIDRLMVEWFRAVLDEPDAEPEDRLSARGRLALMSVQSRYPWQQFFLSGTPLPENFSEAMRKAYLYADPDFRFVEMRPRPIDLGIVNTATRTLEKMSQWRTATWWIFWASLGLMLLFLFIATH